MNLCWRSPHRRQRGRWYAAAVVVSLLVLLTFVSRPVAVLDSPPTVVPPGTSINTKHGRAREGATADTNANEQRPSDSDSKWTVQMLTLQNEVKTPRRPKRVEEFLAARSQSSDSKPAVLEAKNSAPIDSDDIRRAEESYVAPLTAFGGGHDRGGAHDDPRAVMVLNAIRSTLIDTPDDAAPFYTDYGAHVTSALARAHPNATLVGVRFANPSPVGVSGNRAKANPMPPNAWFLHSLRGFDDPAFAPWYRACHFSTVSLVLERVFDDNPSPMPAGKVFEFTMRALPTARIVLAALLPSEAQDLDDHVDQATGEVSVAAFVDWKATVETLKVRTRRLALLRRQSSSNRGAATTGAVDDDSGALVLVEIVVVSSTRACAKTWGAPLIQWGRRLMASVRDGGRAVSFAVRSTSNTAEGSRLGRVIDPIQYIPSVNLDTLLGAGLPPWDRQRVLGEMIATPRYSDPLPHNWVVGLGGRVLRIDKVDVRYDADVDESKGYWGVSTRGYLHLLGYHLCLPIAPSGVPETLGAGTCAQQCEECWRCGSYLPKARPPSSACVSCGRCVATEARTSPSALPANGELLKTCQKTYSSMHAARKVWSKWKSADAAYDTAHSSATKCEHAR